MPNPILILNQPYVFVGLGTLTHTIAADGAYNVRFGVTVPEAIAIGDGAGSGTGLGSGAGGGGTGFVAGDQGLGHGGVGQGFGATNGYQQPPAYGSNETSGADISSALSVLVKKNGSTIFTAPALSTTQSEQQFKFSLSAVATDVITVVLASAAASDNALNGVKSTVSIGQGF